MNQHLSSDSGVTTAQIVMRHIYSRGQFQMILWMVMEAVWPTHRRHR